jgi:hypothetical protein
MNDTNTTQSTEFVLRRLTEPLHLGGMEVNPLLWLALLVPILIIGLIYIVMMYARDGRAVGWGWAVLLGFLRFSVYVFLAGVFLLPAFQNWEETHSQSRVVLDFDTSSSMIETKDAMPTEETPVEKLPSRQDQVVQFLTDARKSFLPRLEERNPVFAYRFGRSLDEDFTVHADGGHWSRKDWEERLRAKPDEDTNAPKPEVRPWGQEDWRTWLKPDVKAQVPDDLNDDEREKFRKKLEELQRRFTGTNLGDSVLTALNREANNMLQGLVIFTDGRSTEGSAQAFRDLADRAQKAKVPIFVVGVGEDRPPVRIDITDLRVPEQARPDDKFKVVVDISGEGLDDKDCDVSLDVLRPSKEKAGTLKPKGPVKFKPGEPPHASAEFEIDPSMFPGLTTSDKNKKPEFEEGEWSFVARVPRDRREPFAKPEHVTDPAHMLVVKRPLRVLLFAGGPTHEYQFVRTLFFREMTDKHRIDLSIYLQPAPGQDKRREGIVQDVPPEHFLTQFPFRLQDESVDKADERLYNLSAYDAIIAFDPDWTRLNPDQLTMLERWVGTHGGGLIVVGGAVNTEKLARPGANRDKLKPVLDLYPVLLQDARIQEFERSATEPWRLNFPGAAAEMEFLKIDEENTDGGQLSGWEEFFTGSSKGLGARSLVHGFYNYYPVEKAKEGAITVATFTDPRARTADGKEQPYLVTTQYGAGKVVWLGAGEMYRLRERREAYHERFWTKLARYAGAGNATRLNRRLVPVMGHKFTANSYVNVEVQVFGRDMLPLPESTKPRPKVVLRLPSGVADRDAKTEIELAPKPSQGEWNGWFTGRFLVKAPGEYGIDFKIESTGDSQSSKFVVTESNPELDNTRPDFDAMYWLASDATDVLGRVDDATQKQLKAALTATRPRLQQAEQPDKKEGEPKESLRLYFTLQNADLIPSCMVTAEKHQKSRGAVVDLWDKGPSMDQDIVNWVLLGVNVLLGIASAVVIGLTVLALMRGKGAEVAFYLLFTLLLLAALVPLQWFLAYLGKPVMLSVVLMVSVMLLAMEWLIRKLLRLA